jgi:hypothetical protein
MRFNKIAPELKRAAEAQARKELGDTYGLIDVGDVATIEQWLELNATIEWAHNMTVLVTGEAGLHRQPHGSRLLDAKTRS